jgi:hypothetical protein
MEPYDPKLIKQLSKDFKLTPEEATEYIRVLELLFSMIIRMGIRIDIHNVRDIPIFKIRYDFKQDNLPEGGKNLCKSLNSTLISNTNFIKNVLGNKDVLYFYLDLYKRQIYKTKPKQA